MTPFILLVGCVLGLDHVYVRADPAHNTLKSIASSASDTDDSLAHNLRQQRSFYYPSYNSGSNSFGGSSENDLMSRPLFLHDMFQRWASKRSRRSLDGSRNGGFGNGGLQGWLRQRHNDDNLDEMESVNGEREPNVILSDKRPSSPWEFKPKLGQEVDKDLQGWVQERAQASKWRMPKFG